MCFVHHVNVEKQAMTLRSVIACTFLYYFMICTKITLLLSVFYSKYSKYSLLKILNYSITPLKADYEDYVASEKRYIGSAL